MKIIQAPGKYVFCCFPKQTADDRAGNSVAQSDTRVGHEAIDDREESKRYQQAYYRKDQLPEGAADRRQQRIVLKLSGRKAFGNLLQPDQYRREHNRDR